MAFHRLLLCGLLILLSLGCTTSKWAVVDEQAINPTETPEIVSEKELLIAEEMPTIDHPVLKLAPYKIIQREFAERIKLQRTVQEYQPKWGFALLAIAGSAISFTTANTGIINSSPSNTQKVALNATGVLLGVLSATNLKESGDPIPTDEIRFLRQTGIELRPDTVSVQQSGDQTASITIIHNGTEIFHDASVSLSNNVIEINVGALAAEMSNSITEESEFIVNTEFKGEQAMFSIPVKKFMESYFIVENVVIQLRSSPVLSRENIIAELGEGSSIKIIDDFSEQWVKVYYGESEAYVQKSTGYIQLRSTAESGPALLLELTDIPFGEIDVENSLPILKNRNPDDRALIISGNRENQAGFRQYAERGEQLFRHYMRTSFRMIDEQVIDVNDPNLSTWIQDLQFCQNLNGGTTIVYLTGFARQVSDEGEIKLVMYHRNEDGEEQFLSIKTLFEELAQCTAEKLVVFADLEYIDNSTDGQFVSLRNGNGNKQQNLANILLKDFPNAFVLFGNRIGQQSSIYSGGVDDDKRHHIFPYFLAEAFKQRKTQMSTLFRHLENNVDYTSRRLHDRPQEVQGFGNFMLDITN